MLSPSLQSFPSIADHHLRPFTDLEDFGLSTNLPISAASDLSNLVQTCAAISGYDLGGEGDLFKAPRPIVEDSVTAFDPIATAISLLSGYGSSITTYSIERADIESIQNGDLLCEAFYGCEKDLLAKSVYVPAPEAADFVLPVRQSEETRAGERNCFSAEGTLQKSDSTNAFSVGSCLLDVHEVDLAAAFGMTTTHGQGDIQNIGVDSCVHGEIEIVPTFKLSSTKEDVKMKERIQKLSSMNAERSWQTVSLAYVEGLQRKKAVSAPSQGLSKVKLLPWSCTSSVANGKKTKSDKASMMRPILVPTALVQEAVNRLFIANLNKLYIPPEISFMDEM
ncbi:hypothetical protein OPV22_032737 [Ensete ventricosum]|uniref:Uncharacterized protein n=1 Tax=Ensete ventricosum TaxID=4639 RepID=A0AAV8PN93_ENSVE|nr:hypothetical protein OPV22_032737 [Ensete ventricosum]